MEREQLQHLVDAGQAFALTDPTFEQQQYWAQRLPTLERAVFRLLWANEHRTDPSRARPMSTAPVALRTVELSLPALPAELRALLSATRDLWDPH
jgi:hypothetical protein